MIPIRTLLVTLICVFIPLMSSAQDVLLTFKTTDGETQEFDLERLATMRKTEFSTTTIWTEGKQAFTGVLLADFLDEVSVSDGTLIATAINDYAVEIPVSDAVSDGPIIAYLRNGEPMSVRDKGPLWIVYPFDSGLHYQTEIIYSRSIWQLDRLETMK